jgi:hypothetical protein
MLGGLRFLDVRPIGYYGCKMLVTIGTKFFTALIVDCEFITYGYMKQELL